MITERDTRRIAAEACLDVRTVRRVLAGLPVRSVASLEAVKAACVKLGIAVVWPDKETGTG